jgi:hypothetical protein
VSLPARRDDPAPPERIAIARREVLDSYARPYRRSLPLALKQFHVHRLVAADLALAGLWALGAITGELSLQLLGATLLMLTLVITAGVLARALIDGISAIRRRTAEWRPGDGDLARARRRRPHAAEADADVAHDEYAVAVADDGRLVTFLYTPLLAGERPGRGAILIPGTPRYEAVKVRTDRFDASDAARAAEQLADAQAHAAALEAAAVEGAQRGIDERDAALAHADETRSTAAALRRITGQ